MNEPFLSEAALPLVVFLAGTFLMLRLVGRSAWWALPYVLLCLGCLAKSVALADAGYSGVLFCQAHAAEFPRQTVHVTNIYGSWLAGGAAAAAAEVLGMIWLIGRLYRARRHTAGIRTA